MLIGDTKMTVKVLIPKYYAIDMLILSFSDNCTPRFFLGQCGTQTRNQVPDHVHDTTLNVSLYPVLTQSNTMQNNPHG